jgi:hypothetical protein
MRQAAEEAEHEHRMIGWRQRAQSIGEREQGHQHDEQRAAAEAGAEHGQQRRADHDAERIDADDVPGGRLVDVQPTRHVRQQAHRRELGHADRKAAERQREVD